MIAAKILLALRNDLPDGQRLQSSRMIIFFGAISSLYFLAITLFEPVMGNRPRRCPLGAAGCLWFEGSRGFRCFVFMRLEHGLSLAVHGSAEGHACILFRLTTWIRRRKRQRKDTQAQKDKQEAGKIDRKCRTHAHILVCQWHNFKFLLRISSGALLLVVASHLLGFLVLRRDPRSVNHAIRQGAWEITSEPRGIANDCWREAYFRILDHAWQ